MLSYWHGAGVASVADRVGRAVQDVREGRHWISKEQKLIYFPFRVIKLGFICDIRTVHSKKTRYLRLHTSTFEGCNGVDFVRRYW